MKIGRMTPFRDAAVEEVFQKAPSKIRQRLMTLRELIFKTAASIDGVGEIEETLKWGEPAYLTSQSKSGTTLRVNWKSAHPTQYAMYVNCQTNLVDTFRKTFPNTFKFEGNRAVLFDLSDEIPEDQLAHCISVALTYHRRKQRRISGNKKPSNMRRRIKNT